MDQAKPMLKRTFQFNTRAVYKDLTNDNIYSVENPFNSSLGFPLEVSLEELEMSFEHVDLDL